jgi:hypothetical protein
MDTAPLSGALCSRVIYVRCEVNGNHNGAKNEQRERAIHHKGRKSGDCATKRDWKPSPLSLCAVWATPSKIAETVNGTVYERALVVLPPVSGLPEKRARATNDRYTGKWV